MILEGIALFRLVEDDSVFHGYLHFGFVCGIGASFCLQIYSAKLFCSQKFLTFLAVTEQVWNVFCGGVR